MVVSRWRLGSLSFAHLNQSWRLPAIEWSSNARQTYLLKGSFGFIMALICQANITVPSQGRPIAEKGEPAMKTPPLSECKYFYFHPVLFTFLSTSHGHLDEYTVLLFLRCMFRREGEGSSKSAVHLILRINKSPHRYRQQAGDYQVRPLSTVSIMKQIF